MQARIGEIGSDTDDRGFGFITPTQGGPEVFAHISAFPRDGQRPRLGERLSFKIGIGKDGKQQAKSIVCPTRPAEKPYRNQRGRLELFPMNLTN